MATVRVSTHCFFTREIMAPSALKTQRRSGRCSSDPGSPSASTSAVCAVCIQLPTCEVALAYGLLVGLHTQELFDHLSSFVERHPTGEMHQMFLLPRGEVAWEQR